MRDTAFEALPSWRWYRDVVGIVNAPVGTGKNLLPHIGINNDRIYRDIWQIARLIRPSEGATVGSAGYLENMPRRVRRVRIKSTDCRVADWHAAVRYRRVKRNAENGPIRQNPWRGSGGRRWRWRVLASHVHPSRLRLSTGSEVKADPDLAVVRANHSNALILGRVLDLVDDPVTLGHVLADRIVGYVPIR